MMKVTSFCEKRSSRSPSDWHAATLVYFCLHSDRYQHTKTINYKPTLAMSLLTLFRFETKHDSTWCILVCDFVCNIDEGTMWTIWSFVMKPDSNDHHGGNLGNNLRIFFWFTSPDHITLKQMAFTRIFVSLGHHSPTDHVKAKVWFFHPKRGRSDLGPTLGRIFF